MAKTAGAAAKTSAKGAKVKPETATGVAVQEVQTPEIKILSPEEYEIEMEKKIAGDLQKYNLADTKIAELKTKYAGITVTDIKDKAQVKALREALSDVVKVRTGITKKKEEINAEYLRLQRAVNAEEKRLIGLVVEIEQPLKDENERVKALEKEEAERKEREEQEKLDARVETLKGAGIEFDGSFYSIGDISVDIVTIKSMKDSDFDFLVAKVEVVAKRIAEEKAEQDRIAAEKAEQDRIEREQFEANQRKLEEERAAFQKQQDEFEQKQRDADAAEAQRKADALAEIVENRTHTLEGLGFTFKPSTKQFIFEKEGGACVVDMATIETSSREHFSQRIGEIKTRIAEINTATDEIVSERAEQQRLAAIEEERAAAAKAKAEEERIAEQQRLENERIAEEERVAAEKAAELEEQRKAALPDVEKVANYIAALLAVEKPSTTSETMGAFMEATDEYLTECDKLIKEELKALKPGE